MNSFHPIATLIYYAGIIGLSMFSDSPVFLVISLIAAVIYEFYLQTVDEGIYFAGRTLRSVLLMLLIIFLFSSIINGLFTHNGATVLFYIGPNRITKEAFIYGMVMSLMISSVIVWFISFGRIMTSDKLIHVFGGLAPVLGLTISMIFRFIPLLRRRYKEIRMGQASLGRGNIKGPINKIRQFTKEISILLSWSLEASIESADSMTARGYGLPGRTSYRIFTFEKRDGVLIALVIILTSFVGLTFFLGAGRVYYYPEFRFADSEYGYLFGPAIMAFILLAFMPFAIDLIGEYRWRKSA